MRHRRDVFGTYVLMPGFIDKLTTEYAVVLIAIRTSSRATDPEAAGTALAFHHDRPSTNARKLPIELRARHSVCARRHSRYFFSRPLRSPTSFTLRVLSGRSLARSHATQPRHRVALRPCHFLTAPCGSLLVRAPSLYFTARSLISRHEHTVDTDAKFAKFWVHSLFLLSVHRRIIAYWFRQVRTKTWSRGDTAVYFSFRQVVPPLLLFPW